MRPVDELVHQRAAFARVGDAPVDEAEREESHRAVWAALRSLPQEQAEVVVLKIWEGLTFSQIGDVLTISPNTAASRYQYAMTKLTSRLSKQSPTPSKTVSAPREVFGE